MLVFLYILFVDECFISSELFFTIQIRDLEGCVRPDDEDESGSIQRYLTKSWERICRIYQPPYKRVTLCGMLACLLRFPG